MNCAYVLSAVCLVPALAFGAEASGDALWRENRRLEKEAAALRLHTNGLTDECRRHEKTTRVLDVTRELMTGKRRRPPQAVKSLRPVLAIETNGVRVLETADPRRRAIAERWMSNVVRPGSTYRFACQMKAEDVKGCANIKFGGYVPVREASAQWPSASVGAGTFDWRTVTFDYAVPSGASFCLVYGLEGGSTGRVWIRDIVVSEITEEEE